MTLVILESPYRGDVKTNKAYLQACIRDCIQRGESPYASHQMLTGALDDGNPEERSRGIEAGLAWSDAAEYVVVYEDLGISPGMRLGIDHHLRMGKPVQYRELPSRTLARLGIIVDKYATLRAALARMEP